MTEPTILMPASYSGQAWSGPRADWWLALVEPPEWDDTRACADSSLELFFAPDWEWGEMGPEERTYATNAIKRQYAEAREVCNRCPFLDHCREYAIAHEAEGVWGATSPQQRDRIRRDRKWINVETHDIPSVFSAENVARYQHDTGGNDEVAC